VVPLSLTNNLMPDFQRTAAQIVEEGQRFNGHLKTPEAREAFAAVAEQWPSDFTKLSA